MSDRYARYGESWKAIKAGRVLVVTWRDYPAYTVTTDQDATEGLASFLTVHADSLPNLTASIDLLVGA